MHRTARGGSSLICAECAAAVQISAQEACSRRSECAECAVLGQRGRSHAGTRVLLPALGALLAGKRTRLDALEQLDRRPRGKRGPTKRIRGHAAEHRGERTPRCKLIRPQRRDSIEQLVGDYVNHHPVPTCLRNHALLEEVKAGTIWINDPLTDNYAGPFGGMKYSGGARELGIEGLDQFRETKHVHLDYFGEKKYFWFPNKTRKGEIPT